MTDKTEITGAFPALPTARSAREHAVPLSTLQTIANHHAHLLWGADIAGGPRIPISGIDGNLIAYAFTYIRSTKGAIRFPKREQLFLELEKIRSEQRQASPTKYTASKMSARFHYEVSQRLGQFGSVYVSASRDRFPVFRASHFLHPYFLRGQQAQDKARRYFKVESVRLEKVYFLGPHREYFEFSSQANRKLINVNSLRIENPKKVLIHKPHVLTSPKVARMVEDAWKRLGELTGEPPLDEEFNGVTEEIIPNYKLIPVVDWTYWCAPTARTMVLGFWDRKGFGRLIDYWLNHPDTQYPTFGNNIPNLMLKLINPDTGTWAPGWKETINSDAGCRFAFQSVMGEERNDWAWNELKAEIDIGRPVHWEIFAPGHAMAAFGYKITPAGKFVIVYTTWGSTPEAQCEEWHYASYGGEPATKTYVNPIIPEEVGSQNNLALVTPTGGETFYQWINEDIRWFVWGDAIKKVDLLSSTDGGSTWSVIASGESTSPGNNAHLWYPTGATSSARIRIKGYTENGEYIAGEGSHSNFTVAGGPILQVAGRVSLLKLDAHDADVLSPGSPANTEAIIVLDSAPTLTLHLGLQHSLSSPVRNRVLSILQEALNQNESVVIDYVKIDSSNGLISRAWIERR